MKLQHVLIILTAAFVMLISKANADFAKKACDQYCSKHNPGNAPYKLNCLKADSDDGFKECVFYCSTACEEQCSTSSFIIFCGEKVEIKNSSTSTSEIVKIVIAVIVLLLGGLILGLGVSKKLRNRNPVGYESVGEGTVGDSNNPGVMMTQQGQEPASSADTATDDGS